MDFLKDNLFLFLRKNRKMNRQNISTTGTYIILNIKKEKSRLTFEIKQKLKKL